MVIGVKSRVVILVFLLGGDDDRGEILLDKLLVNEYSANTTIAITEWVDELKFIVKIGDFSDKFTVVWLIVTFDQLINKVVY